MTEKKKAAWRSLPGPFWAANVMEIFERMGWYGFYAVSTLYLTGAVEDGGLGLSSEDRGVIQGVATFFLYLFPALFGALADRYGYKRMFVASAFVMVPGYMLLGIPEGFWGFFAVYFLVAIGHGMFKPVVISTIARTTDARTGSIGFGIFYMMVNIGGFIGPIVAGVVRGWDWDYVFWCSAGWLALMALIALLFYREPAPDEPAPSSAVPAGPKRLAQVLGDMVALIGNVRFFLLVAGVLVVLVMGSKWLAFSLVGPVALGWILVNLALDLRLRRRDGAAEGPWYAQPMRIGEGRYLLFLLLMAGFWTSFNQIFMTLPEYIRDYVDTRDLVDTLAPVAGAITGFAGSLGLDTSGWAKAVLEDGQVKPEHIINLNAFGIIVGQVWISAAVTRLRPLTTIVLGSLITVVSFVLFSQAFAGWFVVGAVLTFSVGEMFASPKSKEYAGRIAPPDKVGMYMGYFYWCVALGNLFGGLLSGVAYQHFGPEGVDDPATMWLIFGGLALGSTVALKIYDRWVSAARQPG